MTTKTDEERIIEQTVTYDEDSDTIPPPTMSHQPSKSNEAVAQRIIDEKLSNPPGSIMWTNEWLKAKIIQALAAKDAETKKAVEEERERFLKAFEEELKSNTANLPYWRYIARWKDELFTTPPEVNSK